MPWQGCDRPTEGGGFIEAALPGGALGDRALPVPCAGNLFRFGNPGLRPSCRFHDIISYLNIARLLDRV